MRVDLFLFVSALGMFVAGIGLAIVQQDLHERIVVLLIAWSGLMNALTLSLRLREY